MDTNESPSLELEGGEVFRSGGIYFAVGEKTPGDEFLGVHIHLDDVDPRASLREALEPFLGLGDPGGERIGEFNVTLKYRD